MTELLKSLNLEQYKEIFENEGIDDLEIFKQYSVEELKELGVKGGHIKKFQGSDTNIVFIDSTEEKNCQKTNSHTIKKIFISYGHDEHAELIQSIRDDLCKNNFDVWMDDEGLRTKDYWSYEIELAIENADEIIYFITPHSARRPDSYCLKELRYALDSGKEILPVMLDYYKVPIDINLLQWIDLQPLAQQYNKGIYKRFIVELVDVILSNKQYNKDNHQVNFKQLLKPLDFTYDIKKHIQNVIGREWLYKDINKLLIDDDTNLLWITAEAGFGKTAFSTLLMTKHPNAAGIFFCDYKSNNRKNPKNLLTTLMYQLTTQIVEYKQLLEDAYVDQLQDIYNMSSADLLQDLLIQPLNKLEVSKQYFFIIDALDEGQEDNGKNSILELISNYFMDLPIWLNIIITSRLEPELERKLKVFDPIELKADQEKNIEDLKLYIKDKFGKLNNSHINSLINKSEGNILYLKNILSFNNINNGDFSVKDIGKLPKGMEGFYQTYFERKFKDMDIYKKDIHPFVNIMVSSREGLPVSLVAYILDMNLFDFDDVLRERFGSLLEEYNDVLTFYHKSLFDWLSNRKKTNYAANIEQGTQLIVNKLWGLYKSNKVHEFSSNYESYLLEALYNLKSYEKLNEVLQDILFIGKMYDTGKYMVYRQILSCVIENKPLNCDIKTLKLYESFFEEKEHFILYLNDEAWKPSQSMLQLVYEDGDNSPLSLNLDECLKNHTVTTSWLRNICRNTSYTRSGLSQVYNVQKTIFDIVEHNSDNNVIIFYKDYTIDMLDVKTGFFAEVSFSVIEGMASYLTNCYSGKNLEIIIENDEFMIQKNGHRQKYILEDTFGEKYANGYLLRNCEIIYNRYNNYWPIPESLVTFYHISLDGEVKQHFNGHTEDVNGVLELKNNRFLSYSEDTTLIEWDLDTGEKISLFQGHYDSVKNAIELKNGNILSYSIDNTLRLWKRGISNENNTISSEVLLICSNGDYVCQRSTDLLVFDKCGSYIKTYKHELGDINVIELSNNLILSYETINAEVTIHIWSKTNNKIWKFDNVLDDEHIFFVKMFDNNNFLIKVGNAAVYYEDTDCKFDYWKNKVYLFSRKNLFKKESIIFEKDSIEIVDVSRTVFLLVSNDNNLCIYCQDGKLISKMFLDDIKDFKFFKEFKNDMFIVCLKNIQLLLDLEGNVVNTIDNLIIDVKGCMQLNANKFILYTLNEVYLLNMEGKILFSFKNTHIEIVKIELYDNNNFVLFSKDRKLFFYDFNGNYINTFYLSIESKDIDYKIINKELYVNTKSDIYVYILENISSSNE